MISYALRKAQKRSKKTLSLHLTLILGIQPTIYKRTKTITGKKKGNPEEVEGRRNVISRVTTLDLNVQCSFRHTKKQESMAYSKKKKLTESDAEKD